MLLATIESDIGRWVLHAVEGGWRLTGPNGGRIETESRAELARWLSDLAGVR